MGPFFNLLLFALINSYGHLERGDGYWIQEMKTLLLYILPFGSNLLLPPYINANDFISMWATALGIEVSGILNGAADLIWTCNLSIFSSIPKPLNHGEPSSNGFNIGYLALSIMPTRCIWTWNLLSTLANVQTRMTNTSCSSWPKHLYSPALSTQDAPLGHVT